LLTRQRLILTGVAVLALAGSFGAGRYSRPARVVTVDKVRTEVQYRDRVVTQVQHDVQTVHDVATRTVTRWETVPGKPAVVVQTVERQAEFRTNVRNQATQDRTSEGQAATVTLHAREGIEASRLSILVLGGVQREDRQLIGLPGHAVVGGAVTYRIAGPVVVGLGGLSAGGGTILGAAGFTF